MLICIELFIEDLHYVIDAFAYLKSDCTEDYLHNLFEFLSKASKFLTLQLKVSYCIYFFGFLTMGLLQEFLLTQAAAILLLATNPDKKTFCFSSSLLKCLSGLQGNESGERFDNGLLKEYTLHRNFNPIESAAEQLYECVYWINNTLKKLNAAFASESKETLKLFSTQVYVILLNIVVNIDPDLLNEDIVSEISASLEQLETAKLATLKESYTLCDLIGQELNEYMLFQKEFNALSEQHKLRYLPFAEERFHIVNYEGKDLTESNYEESEKLWLKEQARTATKISAVGKIKTQLKVIRLSRPGLKIRFTPTTQAYLYYTFSSMLSKKYFYQQLLPAINTNHNIFGLFPQIDEFITDVINVLFTTKVGSPIDFHYLAGQLTSILKLNDEYCRFLQEVVKGKMLGDVVDERFLKYKITVCEITDSFSSWKQNNVKEIQGPHASFVPKNKKKGMFAFKWGSKKK